MVWICDVFKYSKFVAQHNRFLRSVKRFQAFSYASVSCSFPFILERHKQDAKQCSRKPHHFRYLYRFTIILIIFTSLLVMNSNETGFICFAVITTPSQTQFHNKPFRMNLSLLMQKCRKICVFFLYTYTGCNLETMQMFVLFVTYCKHLE